MGLSARQFLVLALFLPIARPAPASVAADTVVLPAAYVGLDQADVAVAAQTVQLTLEKVVSYETRRWRSAASGASGSVTPLRTYQVTDGRYCREYLEVVVLSNHPPAYHKGTACRDDDGLWRLLPQ